MGLNLIGKYEYEGLKGGCQGEKAFVSGTPRESRLHIVE